MKGRVLSCSKVSNNCTGDKTHSSVFTVLAYASVVLYLLHGDHNNEQHTKHDIANIAPYVVERTEHAQWVGTFEIVIAPVLVTTGVQNLQTERETDRHNW